MDPYFFVLTVVIMSLWIGSLWLFLTGGVPTGRNTSCVGEMPARFSKPEVAKARIERKERRQSYDRMQTEWRELEFRS